MPALPLTPSELLTTTRSVRKRLDFTRPVEPEVIRACLDSALQAPTGSNAQSWRFVVVTDAEKRRALGDIYRKGWARYLSLPETAGRVPRDVARAATQMRILASSNYLAEHLHEAPVLLLPCIVGRTEGAPVFAQASQFGSILPAVWSFMLAARLHGLGSTWTSVHLMYEEEAATVLGIPFQRVMQVALIPIAYTLGDDFQPARREPLDRVARWNAW